MPRRPPETTDLVPAPPGPPKEPAKGSDVGREVRRWWRTKSLEKAVSEVKLAEAISDVGKLSMVHLARQLVSAKVSDEEKTKIALVMAPKMIAVSRGRPPKEPPPGKPPEVPGEASRGLLDDYEITVEGVVVETG